MGNSYRLSVVPIDPAYATATSDRVSPTGKRYSAEDMPNPATSL